MTSANVERVRWRKSSHSNGLGGECVELAALPGQVLVRDSKDPDGPRLALTPVAARELMDWVREEQG